MPNLRLPLKSVNNKEEQQDELLVRHPPLPAGVGALRAAEQHPHRRRLRRQPGRVFGNDVKYNLLFAHEMKKVQ